MRTFEELYAVVRDLPVVDWHNHLDPRMLREDRPLGSLYDVWVKADPYKHRAMRICGEPERLITGDASEAEKWEAWRRTLPKLVGNPLFAWARMEMDVLGVDGNENASLAAWTPSKLLSRFNVAYLSPCVAPGDDPPAFTLGDARVVPSLRLDAAKLPAWTDLGPRLAAFHAAGCRVVDVSVDAAASFADACLANLCAEAARLGWTLLLHLGALRETSARLRAAAGAAGGFAGMRAAVDPEAVARFLDRLESRGGLPRTILLTLNPAAHAHLAVLSGSFVGEGVLGKVQLGPAWWWCDHAEGIRDVFEKQAAYGVLSTFVGMTTDSRSLLSFVRHDYFRRLLCRWVAEKIAAGDFPDDDALLRPLLVQVCHGNAAAMVEG